VLKTFEREIAGLELSDEVKVKLIEAANNEVNGLSAKNSELLDKLNKKDDNDSAAEKLRALEARLEREQLESKQNYDDALALERKTSTEEREKILASVKEKDALIHKLLVENGLNAELVALDVNKDLMPMIQAGIAAQATVVDGKAMIGDKTLGEYCAEWAETPAGKASRMAPDNSGGNANGGGSNPTSKKLKDMTGEERVQLFRTNPDEFNRLKAEMSA
jgi:hypothetical protein